MDSSVYIAIFLTFVVGVGLCALLVFHFWATRPTPEHELVDTFKIANTRLTSSQMREATAGQFIELGYDSATHQSAILAERERFMNVLNLGPTGAGKTSYFLSTFLWRDIARAQNSVIVFDGTHSLTLPVLALASRFQRRVRIFPDAGCNPLAGEGSARERAVAFADLLAQTPEVGGGASDYYSQVEQLFVRVMVPLFERAYRQVMTLRELLELAASADRRLRLLSDAGMCQEVAEYHLHFDGWSAADWKRNLSGLITFLDRLMVGSRAYWYNQRSAISLEEAIERKELIIIREGGERHSQDRTLGLLFMIALQRYAARRDVERSGHLISVYLDEAHMYFNPNFPTFIATSRQKRLAVQLGFQNFGQFEPFTDTVISNARTWLVHGGLTFEDASLIANTIGQRQYINHALQYTDRNPGAGAYVGPHTRQDSLIYDYLLRPHQIQGLASDTLLALSLRDREVEAMRLLKKPAALQLERASYQEMEPPAYAPPTIWDERDQQPLAVHLPKPPHSPHPVDQPKPTTVPKEPGPRRSAAVTAGDADEKRGEKRGDRAAQKSRQGHGAGQGAGHGTGHVEGHTARTGRRDDADNSPTGPHKGLVARGGERPSAWGKAASKLPDQASEPSYGPSQTTPQEAQHEAGHGAAGQTDQTGQAGQAGQTGQTGSHPVSSPDW